MSDDFGFNDGDQITISGLWRPWYRRAWDWVCKYVLRRPPTRYCTCRTQDHNMDILGRIRSVPSAAWNGYWPIADFARTVQGREETHMAMLVGYFDESGTSHPSKVTLVAGCVTDTMLWTRLERPWKEELHKAGVSWFHAVDCEHRNKEFEHIDTPIREYLVHALSTALGQLRAQCFVSAVNRDDWKFAPKRIRELTLDDPFYFCFELCLQQISSWSKNVMGGELVSLVFAKQQEYEERALQLHEYYQRASKSGFTEGIGAISFGEPRCLVPLQAADMIAYESHKYAIASRTTPTPQRRPAMQNFEDGGELRISFMIHDRDSLAALRPRADSSSG